jgi:poly(hydroxyalkanoate) depolymerase family esterase
MVKLAPGVRLLRSLAKGGKAQRRAVGKAADALWSALLPAPPRRTRAVAKAASTAKAMSIANGRAAAGIAAGRMAAPPMPSMARETAPARARVATVLQTSAPAPGKWLAAQHTAAAGAGMPAQRIHYWLYLPDQPTPREGWPLVVMLHGCQQTATQFAQGTRMNQAAERLGYAVLYPQQSLSVHAQRCWKWYERATQQGGGELPLVMGVLGQVMAQYAIDRSRIYAAGISAGAGMAHILALHHPELIAAVGLHSGPAFGAGHSPVGALAVMRHGAGLRAEAAIHELIQARARFPALPTILIQGWGDTVVRPVNQQQLVRQSLLLNGLPPSAPPRVTLKPGRGARHGAHRIEDYHHGRKLLLRVAQVDDLPHAWSGGDAALKFNHAAGPDASRMLLDFFKRHRRR